MNVYLDWKERIWPDDTSRAKSFIFSLWHRNKFLQKSKNNLIQINYAFWSESSIYNHPFMKYLLRIFSVKQSQVLEMKNKWESFNPHKKKRQYNHTLAIYFYCFISSRWYEWVAYKPLNHSSYSWVLSNYTKESSFITHTSDSKMAKLNQSSLLILCEL